MLIVVYFSVLNEINFFQQLPKMLHDFEVAIHCGIDLTLRDACDALAKAFLGVLPKYLMVIFI